MIKNTPVITLCGSTRFADDFKKVNEELTLQGYVVLSVGVINKDAKFDIEQCKLLDNVHKRKIDMSDAIYVISRDGYVGKSTHNEIQYAYETGKHVYYMEDDIQLKLYDVGDNLANKTSSQRLGFIEWLKHIKNSISKFCHTNDTDYQYCHKCGKRLVMSEKWDTKISLMTNYVCKNEHCANKVKRFELK